MKGLRIIVDSARDLLWTHAFKAKKTFVKGTIFFHGSILGELLVWSHGESHFPLLALEHFA
jgi:hypothetical protein